MNNTKKTIYIVGPTASGKSDLAIALAQKYNGEVISADSRQIYRGLDVGTGKEQGKLTTSHKRGSHTKKAYVIDGIPHYMIDTHHPNTPYNCAKFIKKASKIKEDILKRNKIPIVCGGTMFWAQGLLEETTFPEVIPNLILRKKLAQRSSEELLELLKKKDSLYAKHIIEQNAQKNTTRIIRALEIIDKIGAVPQISTPNYTILKKNNLIIAIDLPKNLLHQRIEKRMHTWFDSGIFSEIKMAHREMHVPWKRLESFGLEYKWCTRFVREKISYELMQERTITDLKKYAKRQMTWLRRWEKSGAPIERISTQKDAFQLADGFLRKNKVTQR